MGTLAVCDRDKDYVDAFAEYVGSRQSIPFKVTAFTGIESLEEYMAVRHVDILLISSDMMAQEPDMNNVDKVILLISGNVELKYKDYTCIYRYQSMEHIIRQLLDGYGRLHKEEVLLTPGAECSLMGVYSPVGRTGQTTFCLVMGEILAEDAPTLYINMEEFSALDKIFGENFAGDLSDLMYIYKRNPDGLAVKLQEITKSMHSMDYIPPLSYSTDLRNINVQEWISMIDLVAALGNYRNVILDIGSVISDVFQILDACNIVYMPINDDEVSLMKVTAYEEYMMRTGREKLLNRTAKIKIPKTSIGHWDRDYMEQQLMGSVGRFIRKMLREAA